MKKLSGIKMIIIAGDFKDEQDASDFAKLQYHHGVEGPLFVYQNATYCKATPWFVLRRFRQFSSNDLDLLKSVTGGDHNGFFVRPFPRSIKEVER